MDGREIYTSAFVVSEAKLRKKFRPKMPLYIICDSLKLQMFLSPPVASSNAGALVPTYRQMSRDFDACEVERRKMR